MEIGESLCASWLKHVKKCAIVQTNWKPSFQWRERNEDVVATMWQNAGIFFTERHLDVIGGNVDYYQALMQTECDCFGVSFEDENGPMFYVLESAIHSSGLGYEGAPTKVASKMLRSALALYYFCGIRNAEIGFVTPKISPDLFQQTIQAIEAVQQFFAQGDQGFMFTFRLYANEPPDGVRAEFVARFDREIVRPICLMHPLISDVSEVFIRAINLRDRAVDHLRVEGSNLRRALKDLGIKFEEFDERCATFTGIYQMIVELNDEGGSRVKAIRDYVSWRYRDILNGQNLRVSDIRRYAEEENRQEGAGIANPQDIDGNEEDTHARIRRRFDIVVNQQVIPDGEGLSMRESAFRTIQYYVEITPGVTFEALREAFPRRVNRYHETVVLAGEQHDLQRYLGNIRLNDGREVRVCGEWIGNGPRSNWPMFIDAAAGVGIDIVEHGGAL